MPGRHAAEPRVPVASPGTVAAIDRDGILIATGDGLLRITEVQMPGKRRTPAGSFAHGARLALGERLGE
jgi:methionyl-tRNA formyltransferase